MMNEKEERKRVRRERIRRRFEKSQRENVQLSTIGKNENKSKSENEKCDNQIMESLALLMKKKQEVLDAVSNFKADSVKNETVRRLGEESAREKRYRLADTKGEVDDDIKQMQNSWESLKSIEDPMDLFTGMGNMHSSYNDVLLRMDEVINQLKQQLVEKDEAYLENLRRQYDVTTQLQSSIDKSILDLQMQYHNELKSILDSLVDDRARRVNYQLETLKESVQNKALRLQTSLKVLPIRRDEKLEVIKSRQGETNLAYNNLKSTLHGQVNELERDLAVSRSVYQVNADQLEYNLRAICEKNIESEDKIKKRKKLILSHKEELSKELERSKSSDTNEKRKNCVLNQDCTRLECQYNNLLNKLHRFETLNGQKYVAAAAMHEDDISSLSNRIMNAKKEVTSGLHGR